MHNKLINNKKKAFTLIELLIVIAIIGILFIILVSKVDFATDKAKATGVQTDFRSFQVAIETVAKEHAGLATFGWDTGDTNGDRVRNSYDKGDTNQNGKKDPGEVFVGSKTYGETWTNIYTLTNPANSSDTSAIFALESAINKNLDPKLHITINDDLTITMANGAQDPWKTEYHGQYITNAAVDGKDRGAIVIYSNGANQEWGSEHSIAGGVVVVNVPGNNVYGKDDYGIAVVYTYVNGYGEVKAQTSGFSQNQEATSNSNNSSNGGNVGDLNNVPVIGDTKQFATLITSSTLKDIYDLSTSPDKEEYGEAAILMNNETHLSIALLDETTYTIYYEFYNASEDYWYSFSYATEGIVELGYVPEAGWYMFDDDSGEPIKSNAPYITFAQDLIIDMPNGLSDIAPLFVEHKHNYINCKCDCGDYNHTFVGNICSKCSLSDRGYYYDVVYWGQSVNYYQVDYRYFAIVFNKDDTISISRHTTYDGELYVEWDSLPIIWDEDAKTIKFKLPIDPDVHNEYVDLSMSIGGDSITWAEDYTHLYYKDEIDYIELVARYDLPVDSLPLEEPIYDQSGDIYTFHADNTVDVYDSYWGDTTTYTFEWDSKSIMKFFDSNGYESSTTYHLSFTGKGIFANRPS